MKAVIYPRVSSEDQAQRGTIRAQHFDLPAVVQRQGWKLVRPVEHYDDAGKSAQAGKLDRRSGFARLVADMQKRPRPFDVVVVADLDRLTRSVDIQERGEILGAFQRTGTLIYDCMKGQLLDLKTSTGDLMAVLGTWFAAEDNRKRSERTRAGQRRAAREGRKPNGRTPLGLAWSREAGWSVDPVLGPVVREVFHRVAKGDSLAVIARDLHGRRIPTASTGKRLGTWSPSRVWAVVRNVDLYAHGRWVAIKDEGTVVAVPPIVTVAEAQAADQALASHGRRNKGRQRQEYLCQGLLRCAVCGANVAATYVQPHEKVHRYYTCARRRRRPVGGDACQLPTLRAEDVDARVWAALARVLERPEYLQAALAEQAASAEEAVTWAKDLQGAQRKLDEYDQRCERMADDYRRGRIPNGVWDKHLAAVDRERPRLLHQVEAARAGIDISAQRATQVTDILAAAKRLSRRIKGADFATKRELVQALIPGQGKHVITVAANGKLTLGVVFAAGAGSLPVSSSTASAQHGQSPLAVTLQLVA